MNILILGYPEDQHAAHIYHVLEERGVNVNYWDTQLFPKQLKMSWYCDRLIGNLNLPGGRALQLSEIHSVYWRNFTGVDLPNLKDPYQQYIATNDAESLMKTMLQVCPAHWVNSWQAYQFHQEKPRQLSTAKKIGIKIPQTLITNDAEEIITFVNSQKQTIFKPVYGGSHTRLVTEELLERKRLELVLRLAPVTIQEYIPGTNIRAYVIGNSVYGAQIKTESVDFRDDQQAEIIPVILPEDIQEQCLKIAREFFLDWTGIDWRLTPDGQYVFLEANPSPMFIYFERVTGFPLTKELVNLLMQ